MSARPDTTSLLPAVTRHTHDDGTATISIGLANQADLLTDLARALAAAGLMDAFRVLGTNTRAERVIAQSLAAITRDTKTREALTLHLAQGDADQLADQLARAAADLTCYDPTDNCGNQAIDDQWNRCAVHAGHEAALALQRGTGALSPGQVEHYQAMVREARAEREHLAVTK